MARDGCLNRILVIVHHLLDPLGGIEEASVPRPNPVILIDEARHAVGDLGEPGLRLQRRGSRLLQLGDIGQHGQDPESLVVGTDKQPLGVDHLVHGIIRQPELAPAIELLAALPDAGILPEHPLPDSIRQLILEQP
ncbi:hypothetical protein D3C79_610040 [compost metagenome]